MNLQGVPEYFAGEGRGIPMEALGRSTSRIRSASDAISMRAGGLRLSTLAASRMLAQRSGWTDTIAMAGAEVSVDPPIAVSAAMQQAIAGGFTGYGPIGGHPELLIRLRDKLLKVNRLDVGEDRIYCMPGAACALHVLLMTLIDVGDEVLIQDPCWEQFPEMIRLAGGVPKPFRMTPDSDGHLTPDLDHLRAQLTPRTRLALINTPLSPVGTVLTRKEAVTLTDIFRAHGVTVVSDEVYEAFVFDGREHVSLAECDPGVVTVHSFSKSFALPGLRLAYVTGPRSIIEAVRTAGVYTFLTTSAIAQRIGIEVLNSRYIEYVAATRRVCQRRRDLFSERLTKDADFDCWSVEGGLYLSAIPPKHVEQGVEFCERLLHERHVISIPGAASGSRMKDEACFFFGLDERTLTEGASRVTEMVAMREESPRPRARDAAAV